MYFFTVFGERFTARGKLKRGIVQLMKAETGRFVAK